MKYRTQPRAPDVARVHTRAYTHTHAHIRTCANDDGRRRALALARKSRLPCRLQIFNNGYFIKLVEPLRDEEGREIRACLGKYTGEREREGEKTRKKGREVRFVDATMIFLHCVKSWSDATEERGEHAAAHRIVSRFAAPAWKHRVDRNVQPASFERP